MNKLPSPAARVELPRVGFYTRISTDEDHQKYSLGAQKERLEAFCKAQWGDTGQLHKIYRDTESGTHMNRPGLEEMLYDAGTQAFNTLLVFRVDRLSRKVRELAQMVDELTKNGVTLKSITEPFDTSNAAGKMMLQMQDVFAEIRARNHRRAQQGRHGEEGQATIAFRSFSVRTARPCAGSLKRTCSRPLAAIPHDQDKIPENNALRHG